MQTPICAHTCHILVDCLLEGSSSIYRSELMPDTSKSSSSTLSLLNHHLVPDVKRKLPGLLALKDEHSEIPEGILVPYHGRFIQLNVRKVVGANLPSGHLGIKNWTHSSESSADGALWMHQCGELPTNVGVASQTPPLVVKMRIIVKIEWTLAVVQSVPELSLWFYWCQFTPKLTGDVFCDFCYVSHQVCT